MISRALIQSTGPIRHAVGRGLGASETAALPVRTLWSPGLHNSTAKRAFGTWGEVDGLLTSFFFFFMSFSNYTPC